jgi:hypothetical protein
MFDFIKGAIATASVQAGIALLVTATVCYQWLAGLVVGEAQLAIVTGIVFYYFGTKAAAETTVMLAPEPLAEPAIGDED